MHHTPHPRRLLSTLLVAGGTLVATAAAAGMVKDGHGNVGYDTAAECDAAVKAGTATFYKSFTIKPPLKRKGEASVKVMPLRTLNVRNYSAGACDIGAPRSAGRDGVAKELQGKYVPYSPDMLVNVYYNRSGEPVRAMMKQCDNWFGDHFPRAIPTTVATQALAPAPAPTPAPAVAPTPTATPMAKPITPVATAPVSAPVVPQVPAVPVGARQAAAAAFGGLTSPTMLGVAGAVAIGAILLSQNNDDTGTTGTTGTR